VIGVTGATGQLGGMVARLLSRKGVPQRLVVRDVGRAPRLSGAEVAEASYHDGEAMHGALAGVGTLFMVSAKESPDRVEQQTRTIDAAVAAGVERIVYLSFLSAAPDATFTFARDHFHTEEHVRSSGVRYTFLRPCLYVDGVPYFCSVEGVIEGPANEGRIAWVSRADVADVAVAVITGEGHDASIYDVTGPAAVTMTETAEALAEITGREIVFRNQSLDAARASRAGAAPAWEVEGWVSSYAAIATGEMATVSDAVQKLAGHGPQSLLSFLRTHPEGYQHLLIARYRQH
jgi:NAD(P)H dehydrogenase (quinone)